MSTRRHAATRASGSPLYLQIVERLREKISSGLHDPGSLLPSEAALTKEFGVSRVTIRQALSELEQRGLIYRQQGRGTFVSEPHLRQQMNEEAQTIVEALRREGIDPEIKIIGLDRVKPDPQVAALLGTGDDEISNLTRLYLHNSVPIALATLNLPISMSGVAYILSQGKEPGQTTYSLFESMGLVIKEARHVIKTVALDAVTAGHLHMKPGDICLATDRITYSNNGSVLELTKFIYPPGRMRFEITLPRSSSAKVVRIYSRDDPAPAVRKPSRSPSVRRQPATRAD
ncbi:MAG: GntR family transcriptional regulator [Pseudorhodoplanes sp.]|uniref:GntR family transcriptional regulator n=1 Tax=Pseudorhodoplanes sp. TaxID=1934341 RepID=UPI003D11AE2C